MNKDIRGLVYRLLYRLKNDNVTREYRERFIPCFFANYGCMYAKQNQLINWRCLSRSFCMDKIYSFRTTRPVGRLPKNY